MTLLRTQIIRKVQNTAGDAISGATATIVSLPSSATATVYSTETGTATISQPLISGADGGFSGWLEEGHYSVTIESSSGTSTSRYYANHPYQSNLFTDAASVPLTVSGTTAQSANLTEWKNVGGTTVASIDGSGSISSPTITAIQGSVSSRTGNLRLSYVQSPIINGTATTAMCIAPIDDSSYYLLMRSQTNLGSALVNLAYTNNSGTSFTFPNGGTAGTGLPQMYYSNNITNARMACSSNGSVIYAGFAYYDFSFSATKNIYVSTNSGSTFSATTSGTAAWSNYPIVCSSSGSTAYAIRWGTAIVYSNDTGSTWSTAAISPLANVKSICCSSSGSIAYAVTGNSNTGAGTVYKTANSGASWSTVTAAGVRQWQDVDCSSNGSVVYLASVSGTAENYSYLYKSTDAGSNWSTVTSSGLNNWYNIAVSPNATNLLCSSQTYIFSSSDSGSSFNSEPLVSLSTTNFSPDKFSPSGSVAFNTTGSMRVNF